MSTLSSLKQLGIGGGPKLKSLSLAVPHLTSLESLAISDCELFDSISDKGDDGTEWQNLKCLSSLYYNSVPNLKSIPSGLQHVTALRSLAIYDCPNFTIFPELASVVYLQISRCPNLTSIPDGISNLTSLEELYIYDCPNLKSLPDEMLSLKSLQKLTIESCPDLEKRCEKGIGEDWFKIAHSVPLGLPQAHWPSQPRPCYSQHNLWSRIGTDDANRFFDFGITGPPEFSLAINGLAIP
ncbi:putative disease resistance protein rga4 [Quercus suber]|uniref:Disease resistance protein rga4 n=1 Tax=Quercus suber TaxID=58331 RepID=A0AAW0J277_QUESU